MDLGGNETDQSEDIFSDDDGTGDVKFSSPAAQCNTSFLNLSQTPVLFSQQREETSGRAIVPKTPLTLAPFLSKAEGWSSDLETPEGKQNIIVNRTKNVSLNNTPGAVMVHDVTLVPEEVTTPAPNHNEASEEIIPLSQEISKANSNKSKRPPKRRIFGKNNSYYSGFDENESFENHSYELSNRPSKDESKNENEVRKSQSCIESVSPRNMVDGKSALVTKLEQLQELHRQLKEQNGINNEKQDSMIPDDEFVKRTMALEMCDRIPLKVNNKDNEPAMTSQVSVLVEDDIILSPIWNEFEEIKHQTQTEAQSDNNLGNSTNISNKENLENEENFRIEERLENNQNSQEIIFQNFQENNLTSENSQTKDNLQTEDFQSEELENDENFETEQNNTQIEQKIEIETISQDFEYNNQSTENSQIEENFQNEDLENLESCASDDFSNDNYSETFQSSLMAEDCQSDDDTQAEQQPCTLEMLKKEDQFSQIDLGIDHQQKDIFLDDTFIVMDLQEDTTQSEELKSHTPDIDDQFRGFCEEEQGSRELWYFQKLFRAHCSDLLPQKLNFRGFSFSETETARAILMHDEILLNNHLEKYYGIQQPLEDEEIISVEMQESELREEEFELKILPPLVVSVYSGFDTGSGKKLSISVDKIVQAQSILLNGENVATHSIDLLINVIDLKNSDNREESDKKNEEKSAGNKDESLETNKKKNSEENNREKLEIIAVKKIQESDEPVKINLEIEIDESIKEKSPENFDKNSDIPVIHGNKENCDKSLVQASLNASNFINNLPSCAGFHTALGKPIEISEKALFNANMVYNGDFGDDYTDCLNDLTNLKTKSRSVRISKNQTAGFKPVIPRIAPIKHPPKGINSNENKEKISVLALNLGADDNNDKINDIVTKPVNEFKTPQRITEISRESVMNSSFVGFTTASGKAMQISENALLQSKAIFAEIAKEVHDNFEMENEMHVKTPILSSISVKTPGSGSIFIKNPASIPSNSSATPSMAKPFVPLNIKKLEVHSTPAPKSISASSGFITGSGKIMKISEEALARGKQLYAQIEKETTLEFEKTGKIELTEAPEASINRPTSRPFTPLNVKRPSATIAANPLVGFTTGNGAAIKISEVALQKIRVGMEELSTDPEPDTNLDDLSNMKKRMWSSKHKPTDSVKRKNPSDDVTPAGRKRARTGGSDLQARVLFSEIDEEDEELKQAALTSDFNEANENDRILPFKDELCDEVRACTTAFMQDLETAKNKNRWSDSYTVPNPRPLQRRPRSFPHEPAKNHQKNSSQQGLELIPDDLVFDSQEFLDFCDKISSKLKSNESLEAKRLATIAKQEELIKMKKKNREKQIAGSLLSLKQQNSRIPLQSLCHQGGFPTLRNVNELPEKIEPRILSISSTTAIHYQFNLEDYTQGINYAEGIPAGDGGRLIPNECNLAGVYEMERAFLASPGVDPDLLPEGWVKNHYKWIVWKLASMDRIKFTSGCLDKCLTPDQVLKQLKYRYDKEIDRAERPILRRIFEKDEAASHRMVLCVSKIEKQSIENENRFTLELTDGWYSINTLIDSPLIKYIIYGKIKLGMKLMIYGAQLVNLEEGCHPLESSETVRLKINTNSTRRAKWYAKLGLQKYGGPMELSLGHVNPSGGLIGKVSAVVSRVYPIIYKETTPDGEIIFRNAKAEERMQMLCETESKPSTIRQVTACFKIRIADADANGVVTIWQNAEECSEVFKEGNTITIKHATAASGKRSNELQINATRWTTFDVSKTCKKHITFPGRIFTPLTDTMTQSFAPNYGEFDTVGVVVSIGPAPHGMRNFETVNLAWRGDNGDDGFLSLLFWEGVNSYGYKDIATVGSIICCLNCEWRRNTYRSIPTAFCTEKTILTRNPRSNSHLKAEFDCLKYRIGDVHNYVEICDGIIQAEVMKKSGSTPNSITPSSKLMVNSTESTPINRRSATIQGKLEKLQQYGAPPKLSPINLTGSSRVSLDFRSPLSKPPNS